MTKKEESIVLFNQKQVRRHWDEDREVWYFSIVDIIEILTNSKRPRRYWNDLKKKLEAEGSEVSEKIGQLKMTAPDGKQRQTDVLDTENVLRLVQSIPSPKAEPFKLWLARVGYERIEETETSFPRKTPTTLLCLMKTKPTGRRKGMQFPIEFSPEHDHFVFPAI